MHMQPSPHIIYLAHGSSGWWDEIAMTVPVPVIFVVFLVLGKRSRKVARELAAQYAAEAESETDAQTEEVG